MNNPTNCKIPNTFLLGGQKCGSTWLASRLAQHPDVFMAEQEIHFFDKDYNYEKGLAWYSRFFDRATSQSIVAEKTPEYLWANGRGGKGVHSHSAEVHTRIKRHCPDAQFVVVLRDPVHRAVSAFNHARSNGYFCPAYSLESVLFGQNKRIGSAFGILEKGIYADMLVPYFNLFERKQFLVLSFEDDVCGRPKEALRAVCEFLNVAPFEFTQLAEPENQVRASLLGIWLRYLRPLLKRGARCLDRFLPPCRTHASPSLTAKLKEFYGPHNDRLFALLGTRFGGWISA